MDCKDVLADCILCHQNYFVVVSELLNDLDDVLVSLSDSDECMRIDAKRFMRLILWEEILPIVIQLIFHCDYFVTAQDLTTLVNNVDKLDELISKFQTRSSKKMRKFELDSKTKLFRNYFEFSNFNH